MSNNTLGSKTIVCEEVFDEHSIPSEEEVIDYAKKIGIDPACEPHLLPIALNGLMQPLPDGWKPCYDAAVERWYYYNKNTKVSQWEHPLDSVYRNLVKRNRSEGYSSAADDDSKTTAKEELKSFEEVSDLISSRSNDLKPEKLSPNMNEFDKGKDSQTRSHQPLLLRRKQLQTGSQPFSSLQVAKIINNSMRENNVAEPGTKNIVTEHRTFRVSSANIGDSLTKYSSGSISSSKQLQPLRRAQTLDPIPTFVSNPPKTDGPPIKGILRESSFSGLPNRNGSKLNPISGDYSHDEDEKKRSVRFADYERKSLDIRFPLSDSETSLSDEDRGSGTSSPEPLQDEPEADLGLMGKRGNRPPPVSDEYSYLTIKPQNSLNFNVRNRGKPINLINALNGSEDNQGTNENNSSDQNNLNKQSNQFLAKYQNNTNVQPKSSTFKNFYNVNRWQSPLTPSYAAPLNKSGPTFPKNRSPPPSSPVNKSPSHSPGSKSPQSPLSPKYQYPNPGSPKTQYPSPGSPKNQSPSPGSPKNQSPSPGSPKNQSPSPGSPKNQSPSPASPKNLSPCPSPPVRGSPKHVFHMSISPKNSAPSSPKHLSSSPPSPPSPKHPSSSPSSPKPPSSPSSPKFSSTNSPSSKTSTSKSPPRSPEKQTNLNNHLQVNEQKKNKITEKIINTQALVTPLVLNAIVHDDSDEDDQFSYSDHLKNFDGDKVDSQDSLKISKSPYPEKKIAEKLWEQPVNHSLNPNHDNNYKPMDPEIFSLREAIKSIVSMESNSNKSVEKKESLHNLTSLGEKLSKEIQEKVAQLKEQQIENLKKVQDKIAKDEEEEIAKLEEQTKNKLEILKTSMDKAFQAKEQELQATHKKEVADLIKKLEDDRKRLIAQTKANHEAVLQASIKDQEDRLNLEKTRIELETRAQIERTREFYQEQLDDLKAEEDQKISDAKAEGLIRIEEVKKYFEGQVKEAEEKFQREAKLLEAQLNLKLENIKVEKETELRRIQIEWDDKISATTVQYKSILETVTFDHDKNMIALKLQFQKEEDELKRSHAELVENWNSKIKKLNDKEPNSLSLNRDFEKMRCEKRIIEDKYRSLKDKYLQLKTDIEMAVERKLQSRARRRKEEQLNLEKEFEEKFNSDVRVISKVKNNNPELNEMLLEERIKTNRPHQKMADQLNLKEIGENDPSSDEQFTSLSLTLPNDDHRSNSISPVRSEKDKKKKLSRGKLRLEHPKDRQGNVLDEVRSQLQELEEIEEQIPANSQGDTYLRYPFHGPGLSTSAEVDFYRHRVIVEQEAVRAARECLLQQKKELETRQNLLRTNNNTSTMQQLQQQERDLTEMEVSLHRTRALLGEKMIRLRLLGQTLNRLVEDSSTPNPQHSVTHHTQLDIGNMQTPSTGGTGYPAENVPTHVLQNLENINSEIRELWSHLSKQQIDASETNHTDLYYAKLPSKPINRPMRRVPSNRAEIEARLQGLREWLQKPPPNNTDWNQLTI